MVSDNLPQASGVLFVLGAGDPEMHAIQRLLTTHAVPFVHARVDGKRVYPANAYRAQLPGAALEVLAQGGRVYLVECVGHACGGTVRIDHHFPGDPGYGRPPTEYWQASSLGQTLVALNDGIVDEVAVTPEMYLIAAADHCLGAAYRGDCPDVDPDALLRYHIAARAAFAKRSEADIAADIETTRKTLRAAPRAILAPGLYAADVRGLPVAELLVAAARERQCCLSAVVTRGGSKKIGCLVGTPAQISAFMERWAPAHQLVNVYGDPARGFAGAYVSSRPGASGKARGLHVLAGATDAA